jgi:hypothetical protein
MRISCAVLLFEPTVEKLDLQSRMQDSHACSEYRCHGRPLMLSCFEYNQKPRNKDISSPLSPRSVCMLTSLGMDMPAAESVYKSGLQAMEEFATSTTAKEIRFCSTSSKPFYYEWYSRSHGIQSAQCIHFQALRTTLQVRPIGCFTDLLLYRPPAVL